MVKERGQKLIAQNKKARYDYHIEDTFEAGLVLTGTEVKSLRAGRASLVDGFAEITDGEVWLHGAHIPEYLQGTWNNHAPTPQAQAAAPPARDRQDGAPGQRARPDHRPAARCTSRTAGPRSRSRSPRARSPTTSATSIAKRDAQREATRELGRQAKGF